MRRGVSGYVNGFGREIGIPSIHRHRTIRTLAKVASTYAKTRTSVYAIIDEHSRISMLSTLPIEDIWGVGWRTAPKLKNMGISTTLQLTVNWMDSTTVQYCRTKND